MAGKCQRLYHNLSLSQRGRPRLDDIHILREMFANTKVLSIIRRKYFFLHKADFLACILKIEAKFYEGNSTCQNRKLLKS